MREIQKESIIGLAVLTVLGLLLGGFIWWNNEFNTPFRDVTLELGDPIPEIAAFIAEGERAEDARFVTDIQPLVSQVGTHTVTLRSRTAQQSVKLTVVDTTAPEVVFRDIFADRETALTPEQFVMAAKDLSPITMAFAAAPVSDENASEAATGLNDGGSDNAVNFEADTGSFPDRQDQAHQSSGPLSQP